MTDIPGNSSTGAVISIGSTITNTLEVKGDHDWFKINLTSGQEITVALDALGTNPSLDTYLIIRDAAGNVLYQDDDIYPNGVDTDSLLSFAANYTGVFYIDVGAYDSDPNGPGDTAGDYRLNVTAFQQPPVGLRRAREPPAEQRIEHLDRLVQARRAGPDHRHADLVAIQHDVVRPCDRLARGRAQRLRRSLAR